MAGTQVLGVPVLGGDERLNEIFDGGVHHAFIGLGTVGDARPRIRLYNRLREIGFDIVSAVHPRATISPSAAVGQGLTVMANAVINAGARLGDDVTINTSAIVEHDCALENHVHIAPGAGLASGVFVGEAAHIGLGASVRQCIRIGRGALVGAGAVVVADVPDNTVVVGVPARVLRRVEQ
jgi:UDP-perosamine 4-acetyltransferase